MKYALGQIIYYLRNNKLHSAPVLSRKCVENASEDQIRNTELDKFFARFGAAGTVYATAHGEIAEEDAFLTKEELMANSMNYKSLNLRRIHFVKWLTFGYFHL